MPRFPFSIIYYQLYLLQLESYSIKRFLRLIFYSFKIPAQLRKQLVWTIKARLLFAITCVTQVALALLVACVFYRQTENALVTIVGFVIGYLATFLIGWLLLALFVILLKPFDYIAKQYIIDKARQKRLSLPNLKVIAIAGSYGKTTMREVLSTVLAQKYKVLKAPETVNTGIGVAKFILKNLNTDTELFVAEMGEHYQGDITELCKIVQPQIGIITGINEAHFERMGSLKNITDTIFELAHGLAPDSVLLLNGDDAIIRTNHQKHTADKVTKWYSSSNAPEAVYKITNETFDQEKPGFEFTVQSDSGEERTFMIPLLGHYALGVVTATVFLAKHLGLSVEEINRGVSSIGPVPHRLEVVKGNPQVTVIDDSFNGNPAGVREAIDTLGRFKDRRKVYITPGLVELGKQKQPIHEKIGQDLAKVANVVVLIRNSATPHIARGLVEAGFDERSIVWFDTALEGHRNLGTIIKPGDVVLFQNDWPENYL